MGGNEQVCGHRDMCKAYRVAGADRCWAHLSVNVLETALGKLAPGNDLDFRNTTVKDDLLCSILDKLRDPGSGRLLIGAMRCDQATFTASVDICDATLTADAVFTGCIFGGAATFASVSFGGVADFSGATFGDDAIFENVTFAGAASFSDCKFSAAKFSSIEAAGDISFYKAALTSLALTTGRSAGLGGPLMLTGLRAAGEVDVCAEASAVHCDHAEFAGPVRLQLAGAELWLDDSAFKQPAIVESWLRVPRSQNQGKNRGKHIADEQLVRVRSLRGVDAEHLTLSDADLSCCLIYGLRRPEQLRLEGRCEFASTPRGWYLRWHFLPWQWTRRGPLYEEHLWRRTTRLGRLGWTSAIPAQPGDPQEPPPPPARLAVLYRQLRQGIEEARNAPGAADLYYGEMEMRRLSTKGRDERWLLAAYWLVSGYGLRASRSMLVLGCLILAAAEALQRTGFGRHPHHPGYVDSLLYATGSVLSLDLSGHLPATLSDWGQVIRMALRIGGPVLLGLGALALRGRVTR
jgi:uncharacterized protein YjbI with pentapeptide repeats